jgi:hypothetical protein
LVFFLVVAARRPPNPERTRKMVAQMGKIASSPVLAIIVAGATLANPGVFIPLALKDISELNPSAGLYAGIWVVFTFASVLPPVLAVVLLMIAPARGVADLPRHLRARALARCACPDPSACAVLATPTLGFPIVIMLRATSK